MAAPHGGGEEPPRQQACCAGSRASSQSCHLPHFGYFTGVSRPGLPRLLVPVPGNSEASATFIAEPQTTSATQEACCGLEARLRFPAFFGCSRLWIICHQDFPAADPAFILRAELFVTHCRSDADALTVSSRGHAPRNGPPDRHLREGVRVDRRPLHFSSSEDSR